MQYYSPSNNTQGARLYRYNTCPQIDGVNDYLLAQATQFVQQNNFNAQPLQLNPQIQTQERQYVQSNFNVQQIQPAPQLQTHQRQYIHNKLTIQPYYSDQALITVPQQHNQEVIHGFPSDDLDFYLTQQAEDLVNNTLKVHSEGIQYILPPVQHNAPLHNSYETYNYVAEPVQQIQQIQYVQQPIQQVQPAQRYIPQPEPQVQLPLRERELTNQFTVQNERQVGARVPKDQAEQTVVRQEQTSSYQAPQKQQNQADVVNPKPDAQDQVEFIQKGPRGEALYKVTEGGINYYIKRGLTPEAVSNYGLAYLIGVGPPVDIIESDGIKMEEGVNLRLAVRDKLITMDEVKSQIQGLHKILFETGMAHCDVKFENCLYFPKYKKVLLIDNGDLAIYGNRRQIKTAGANSTLLIHGNEERNRVGPATDLRGFMHIMKNAMYEH